MSGCTSTAGSSSSAPAASSTRTRSWSSPGAPPEPEERDFYQGLVHVAVAWYQAGRGKRVGCERQLRKARRRLSPYAPSHRGVDVARVLEQVDAAVATVEGGSLDLVDPEV